MNVYSIMIFDIRHCKYILNIFLLFLNHTLPLLGRHGRFTIDCIMVRGTKYVYEAIKKVKGFEHR